VTSQLILTFAAGIIFLLILLGIGVYILVRKDARKVPKEAMYIFRVILALAGAAFAAILPGFLNIEAKLAALAIQAGGALAVFIIIYWINPPGLLEKQVASPKKPVKHEVKSRVKSANTMK
jgi:hypothetical protein